MNTSLTLSADMQKETSQVAQPYNNPKTTCGHGTDDDDDDD